MGIMGYPDTAGVACLDIQEVAFPAILDTVALLVRRARLGHRDTRVSLDILESARRGIRGFLVIQGAASQDIPE